MRLNVDGALVPAHDKACRSTNTTGCECFRNVARRMCRADGSVCVLGIVDIMLCCLCVVVNAMRDDDEEASAVDGGRGSPTGVSTKELLLEAAWMCVCRSIPLFFDSSLVLCVVMIRKSVMLF